MQDRRRGGRDRIVVTGGGSETLALLRMAAVRSDDVLLVAERPDGAARRFVDLFAFEWRDGAISEQDLAGASALLVAGVDLTRENDAVRAARRSGVPIHVAGRPLISDFSLLDLVERRPASMAR